MIINTCKKCQHVWKTEIKPHMCEFCHSATWDKPISALKGNIKKASVNSKGDTKPTLEVWGDKQSYLIYYIEGIEGYHKKVSAYKSKKDSKPFNVYLNYAYIYVKPDFHIARFDGTKTPKPKAHNGRYYGVWQVKDASTNEEMVLWCWTNQQKKWDNLWIFLSWFTSQSMKHEIPLTDDGYIPVVLKYGKAITRFGDKYIKVVGWDNDLIELDETVIKKLDHMKSAETYNLVPVGPRIASKWESTDKKIRQLTPPT